MLVFPNPRKYPSICLSSTRVCKEKFLLRIPTFWPSFQQPLNHSNLASTPTVLKTAASGKGYWNHMKDNIGGLCWIPHPIWILCSVGLYEYFFPGLWNTAPPPYTFLDSFFFFFFSFTPKILPIAEMLVLLEGLPLSLFSCQHTPWVIWTCSLSFRYWLKIPKSSCPGCLHSWSS